MDPRSSSAELALQKIGGLRSWRAAVCVALLFSAGCGRHTEPAETQYPMLVVISGIAVEEPDCPDCPERVRIALTKLDGVFSALLDAELAEITLAYDPLKVGPEDFIETGKRLQIHVAQGAGEGPLQPAIEFPEDLDVRDISAEGAEVDIQQSLVPGKVTILEFHARWCGPCKEVERQFVQLMRGHDELALRRIDIVGWTSLVAVQHLAGAAGLPLVVVYDQGGNLAGRVVGLNPTALDELILKATASARAQPSRDADPAEPVPSLQ